MLRGILLDVAERSQPRPAASSRRALILFCWYCVRFRFSQKRVKSTKKGSIFSSISFHFAFREEGSPNFCAGDVNRKHKQRDTQKEKYHTTSSNSLKFHLPCSLRSWPVRYYWFAIGPIKVLPGNIRIHSLEKENSFFSSSFWLNLNTSPFRDTS